MNESVQAERAGVFQRVRISIPTEPYYDPPRVDLYGIVRLIEGEPELTHCCSLTPSVWVEPIDWEPHFPDDWSDERRERWLEDNAGTAYDAGGYFSVQGVKAGLSGEPYDAESEDDAREEAQANW